MKPTENYTRKPVCEKAREKLVFRNRCAQPEKHQQRFTARLINE